MTQESAASNSAEPPVVIKKYPNRRLYNTETSVYVTLDDLAQLVRGGRDFIVHDAKTGEDLTRQVLTQIIFELESRGSPLLPTTFLRSMIRFYDDKMSSPLHHYLDASMQAFLSNQEKIRSYTTRAMQEFSPLHQLEEVTKQNMAFFEKAFTMFNPFGGFNTPPQQPQQPEEKDERKKK